MVLLLPPSLLFLSPFPSLRSDVGCGVTWTQNLNWFLIELRDETYLLCPAMLSNGNPRVRPTHRLPRRYICTYGGEHNRTPFCLSGT